MDFRDEVPPPPRPIGKQEEIVPVTEFEIHPANKIHQRLANITRFQDIPLHLGHSLPTRPVTFFVESPLLLKVLSTSRYSAISPPPDGTHEQP